jgi:hypothetical protein
MDPDQYKRVKEVFLATCDCPTDQQDQAIASMCADDPQIAAEVKSLLESHRKADLLPRDLLEPLTQADALGPLSSGDARSTLKARFAPGTVICERYRVISLLGIGGMGEVYRADDLTLEQVVALKFLPRAYASDKAWLERFHNEVRLSRQVTHSNVCRIFDIGVVNGEQFITMEFIDGEDLGSLLRRIGRLPPDKAVQIARQLCAGLAAAHDRGVLHRDLKPANVMIDGRGQVRVTDFGISTPADGSEKTTASGTPAYMAPETFSGGQSSPRSDIYSLGLVLYEIFTGRQAFEAHSILEYARLHRQTSPTHPSTIINDIDPLVERVILRCLEKDPAKRPPSALAVAAALPGGNPLAAALEAGETPSPDMVAAAGGDMQTSIKRAVILLTLTIAGLLAVVLLSNIALLPPQLPLQKTPDVLAEKAREVLSAVGCGTPLTSQAQGLAIDEQYVQWVRDHDQSSTRWSLLAQVRPGAGFFWYRQSKDYMISRDDIGMVTLDEPPRGEVGMRTVVLDLQGRLKRLEVLPLDPRNHPPPSETAADFSALFKLADLNLADFKPAPPSVLPPMYADARFAWQGHYPENPDENVTVEAATLADQPVYFRVNEAWSSAPDQKPIFPTPDPRARSILLQTVILVVTGGGVLLAWKNVRGGRVDSQGAHKLSAAFLILGILIWLLYANHVPNLLLEMNLFYRVLGFILVPAGIVWMFYLALEPYVRRIWPETVISWSRLLKGGWADPLVATHVLIGLAVATAATILNELGNFVPMRLGQPAPLPNITFVLRFMARDSTGGMVLRSLLLALYLGLLYLLMLVLFQLVFRRRLLAAAAFILFYAASNAQWQDTGLSRWIESVLVAGLILMLLVRYGLVAAIASLWGMNLLRNIPLTSDMSVWYADQTRFAVGLLIAFAIAAATLATRGWRGWDQRMAV